MSEAAFDMRKCNLPFVPRIPRTPIIADCTIPVAPQAIPDVAGQIIEVPPPYPEPICTQLTMSTSVASVASDQSPQVTANIVPVASNDFCGEGCAFQMHLGFQFPQFPQFPQKICTEISTVAKITELPVNTAPQVHVDVVRTGDEFACQFQMQMAFQLPQSAFQCTLVQIGEVEVTTLSTQTPEVTITSVPITSPQNSCGFQLNFSFGFPAFPPSDTCIPQFVQGLVQTQSTCLQDASVYQLKIERVSNCEYRTNLFVQQPVSPGMLVAEVDSPIDDEIGRYYVKVIRGTMNVADSGDLVDTDFGTVPQAYNAVMWYPPDIGADVPTLIQGNVLVCKKTCGKTDDLPILVGCGGGRGLPTSGQMGQLFMEVTDNYPAFSFLFLTTPD